MTENEEPKRRCHARRRRTRAPEDHKCLGRHSSSPGDTIAKTQDYNHVALHFRIALAVHVVDILSHFHSIVSRTALPITPIAHRADLDSHLALVATDNRQRLFPAANGLRPSNQYCLIGAPRPRVCTIDFLQRNMLHGSRNRSLSTSGASHCRADPEGTPWS